VGGELVMILNDANQSMEIKTILSVLRGERGGGQAYDRNIYTNQLIWK